MVFGQTAPAEDAEHEKFQTLTQNSIFIHGSFAPVKVIFCKGIN